MARRRRPAGVPTPVVTDEPSYNGQRHRLNPRHTSVAGTWDEHSVTDALRDWTRETGIPPRSLDFCPSTERSLGQRDAEPSRWEKEHPRWPGSTTVYRYFESWSAALLAAGLPAPEPVASRRDLPDRVRSAKRLQAAGLTVSQIAVEIEVTAATASRYLRAHECPTCADGVIVGGGKRCASCAVRASNPRRWTAAELVAAVKAWDAEHGQPPRTRDWIPSGNPDNPSLWTRELPRWPPASAGRIVFGSWAALLTAAGFDVYNPSWTHEEVLASIRAWNDAHGRPPAKHHWDTTDGTHPSSATVRRMFGTFVAAVQAAGLQSARNSWTQERILVAVNQWTTAHGSPPRATDWTSSTDEHPCSATVYNRFGTWTAAITAARGL